MENRTEWALLIGRIVLGTIMLAHGIQKLMAVEKTIGMFDQIGLPAFMAYLTIIIEGGAGLTLLLGVFVIPSAVLIGLTMLSAIILVKLKMGLIGGFEFPLALLGLAIILSLSGSRKLALSNIVNK